MHQLTVLEVWILLALVPYTWGYGTTKVETLSKYRLSLDNHKENWHSDTLRPSVNYEPAIVSTSDFYLKEISKQLTAINKKIDRAMIRLIGSTVKGDDNDENIRKDRYSNFTEPNCESLINTDLPSGIYHFPKNAHEITEWIWNIFAIYCDQSLGGGWTVVQRRGESSSYGVNFTSKCWDDYAKGFGDLNGEFWLGNEWIHRVSSHKDNYRLKVDGYSTGHYTDSSSSDNSTVLTNSNLTTSDLVNLDHACTMDFHGTWWYPDNCIGANLNSDYYKSTKMMIRLRNNRYPYLANNKSTLTGK